MIVNSASRPISDSERSGALVPTNLRRFEAQFIPPADAVRDVVDTYWAVRWNLPPGEQVTQRIIDFPAITFSIEEGEVPAPYLVTAIRSGAWSRVIRGSGSVFAIRLRPAGLRVLSDVAVHALAGEEPVTPDRDPRAHALLRAIASAGSEPHHTTIRAEVPKDDSPAGSEPHERATRADALILNLLRERPLSRAQTIANAAVDALTRSARVRPGSSVAAELGTSERTLQRALQHTLGIGPNDVSRRIRLQEVVRQLSLPGADASATAAAVGYADQAHLINEFRTVTGITPGHYLRDLARSQQTLQ